MRMFSEVKGMQQLYKHRLLYVIFVSFLSNPDLEVAHTALSCVLNFKVPYVKPYKEQLRGMLTKSQFRETLTKFDISPQGGIVDSDHREHLFPLVIRILFGRLSARGSGNKSSKDSPAVRRAAILSFLSGLCQNEHEIDYFIYMMVRSFIPPDIDMQLVDCGHQCREHITIMIQKATPKDLYGTNVQRQGGFLNLMSDVIKKLGFGIIDFIPIFMELFLTIIEYGETQRKVNPDANVNMVTDSIEGNQLNSKQNGKVRSLCFLRISELMTKFASTTNFDPFKSRLWTSLQPGLLNLSSSVVNAEKPPSLLLLLVTMSSHPKSISLLMGESNAVEAVFQCISVQSRTKVVDCALKFVDNLLTEGGLFEESSFDGAHEERPGTTLVIDHLELLIGQFTRRLESGSSHIVEDDQLGRGNKEYSTTNQLLSRELSILCRISELLVHEKIDSSERKEEVTLMMESLCKLLLPFLNFNVRLRDSNQSDILGILRNILPRIRKTSALTHLQSLARLLGPNKSNSGISSLDARQRIIACIEALTEHGDDHAITCLAKVTGALKDLAASHPKRVDECNFDKVLPILNGLGKTSSEDKTWMYYISADIIDSNENEEKVLDDFDFIKTLFPLMFYCLHMLYDQDGVVSRGSLKALKTLVNTARKESSRDRSNADRWLKLIESSLVPRLLVGLKTKNMGVRRSFILLLAEVSSQFKSQKSLHFYGDLNALIQNDDQNLDFFINITHIQIHRRARALGRLRKLLQATETNETCQFSVQSLSNVLLPLAMNPIYDYEKNAEETYALESIATVGSILKHMPWGKYQRILWKALLELPRFEKQERYFIAMICSMIDSFHFDLKQIPDITCDNMESSNLQNETIWRPMNSRIIPKIESYLQKEKIDRGGRKVNSLRAPIVLALVKLFKKMPSEVFESKLSRLLTVICNALADKDSNERELARNTLSKLAVCIGVEYLSDIIQQLAISLSEGYKLHVRAATLHSVLLSLSHCYLRPLKEILPFDQCLPAMMDVIQQDIFGRASEMKDVESVNKRLVKEAMGVKSYSSLETISRMILFKPSLHTIGGFKGGPSTPFSSIHVLVHPFLQRIRDPEIDSKTIGKVKECLNRIAIGVSQNTSTTTEEMLPFVYATVFPFISNGTENDGDSTDISDDEDMHGLEISKTSANSQRRKETTNAKSQTAKSVFEWAPSQSKGAKSSKCAYDMKMEQKAELRKVQDGVNAPKLTGTSRYEALKSSTRDFNDPATSSAVSFALSLLHTHLKKAKLGGKEMLADPFVKILTHCVRYSKDTSAILLSLKCLQVILRLDLPSVNKYRSTLASHTLRILSMSSQNTSDETVQSCFKTLTLLITNSKKDAIQYLDDTNEDPCEQKSRSNVHPTSKKEGPPLSEKQMPVLVSLLQAAIIDTEQHNATFSVIKAITSTQYVSSEYYDLMEDMLKMSVQSQQQSVRQVRFKHTYKTLCIKSQYKILLILLFVHLNHTCICLQQAAKIFMQYLIEYPMGKQRIENHLKQMVLNAKYEYEDGRQSALELVYAVIQKLPIPLLEEYTQVFFLPLVLQLVNDESKACRETVSKCIVSLLKRLSNQVLQSLHEYAVRWSAIQGEEGHQLRRTSIQLFGIFLDARIDFMKKGDRVEHIVAYVQACLENEVASSSDYTNVLNGKEWEMTYFCLQTMEKLCKIVPLLVRKDVKLWGNVIRCLVHPHPWIKLISSRIIHSQFSGESSDKYTSINEKKNASSIIMRIKGSLFDIVRNLCFQLNSEEDQLTEDISTMAIRNLSWAIKIMNAHPSLCYKENGNPELADDDNQEHEEEDEIGSKNNIVLNPVTWLITRLSNIAKKSGILRREAIFKCFAAFASIHNDVEITATHLELMLEPLNRAVTEVAHKEENSYRRRNMITSDSSSDADLPKEVLQLLENACGTEVFMCALASVKSKAREKRVTRKQGWAAEAVHDPEGAAKRRLDKNQKEKNRRKRRIQEQKANRGVFTKKPRHIVS